MPGCVTIMRSRTGRGHDENESIDQLVGGMVERLSATVGTALPR
jgi:hypothetical protein